MACVWQVNSDVSIVTYQPHAWLSFVSASGHLVQRAYMRDGITQLGVGYRKQLRTNGWAYSVELGASRMLKWP